MPYVFLCWLLLAGAASAFSQPQRLTRGPYLQVVTPGGITIRWRTETPSASRVWFGTDAASLSASVTDTAALTEHIVSLTGLSPATRYFYAVGAGETRLAGGAEFTFRTAPPAGDTRPFRIWALGDFGNGSPNQLAVYEQYRRFSAGQPADLWLWLGDNAYCCGTDVEYQRYVFDVYGEHLRSLPSYSTPGNHDYADQNQKFDSPYFSLLSSPRQGEAGGTPSGSKQYYSFDYGNVHFVSLDSFGLEAGKWPLYDPTGDQVRWLERDLAATRQPWIVVIFHHPPYTKTARDSDSEEALRLLRENLTPVLERYRVDLVLSGHSHTYERTYRIHDHRGLAATFDPAQHLAEKTNARYDGSPNSCPILSSGKGTVYVVNGSGGSLGGRFSNNPDHPAMAATVKTLGGSLVLDVNDNRLDARFIASDGSIQDQFTLLKNVNLRREIRLSYGDTVQLQASWPAKTYRWSATEQTGRKAQFVARQSGSFTLTATDEQNCLRDEFVLTVTEPTATDEPAGAQLTVFPNPTAGAVTVELRLTQARESSVEVVDAAGRVVRQAELKAALYQQHTLSLDAPGTYTLRVRVGGGVLVRRIVKID